MALNHNNFYLHCGGLRGRMAKMMDCNILGEIRLFSLIAYQPLMVI